MPAKDWLSLTLLAGSNWHPETIALFLCRQGKGGLPIQNLDGCLHNAIHGTIIGSQYELKKTLTLLVKGGADVYARDDLGRTVSEIACCTETRWYNGSWLDFQTSRRTVNFDLRLKKIWMDALSVCGYDPEEVISASKRVEELCNSDTDRSFVEYEKTSTVASGYSERDNDSTLDQVGESDVAADDVMAQQPDAVLLHHYESLLLEGDAEVWSS